MDDEREQRTGRGRSPCAEMTAHEVARLLRVLAAAGIRAWIDGGWGVDALIGKQRRRHDDLDLVVELEHVPKLQEVLRREGYAHKDRDAPLSFMVVDPLGRQVDVHPVVSDEDGDGIYQMDHERTWTYPADGFEGVGHVAGKRVRCLTARVQMLVHSGYELGQKDHDEIAILHERFGVAPPSGYAPPEREAGG